MVDISAGKKLSEARLARSLSIDAAAHATKMRPDKILALENDDYTRFGNIAYAKSFLLMYSKFLGVDVSEQLRDLDHRDHRVNIEEYQYLSNAPAPKSTEPDPARNRRERTPPSIVPLFVFILFGCGVLAVMYYRVQEHRLGLDPSSQGSAAHEAAKVAEPATENQTPAAAATSAAPASPVAPLTPAATAPPAVPPTTIPKLAAAATPAVAAAVQAARQSDSAVLQQETAAAHAASLPVDGTNEVIVVPLKKTWVTVRRDSPTAPVYFGDYLYPEAPPLKLHGPKFFIEVQDQAGVQIRKNGHPIAYQAPGISVE